MLKMWSSKTFDDDSDGDNDEVRKDVVDDLDEDDGGEEIKMTGPALLFIQMPG